MTRKRSRSLLTLLAFALAAAGCDGRLLLPTALTTQDLEAARAKWAAQRITDYDYTLQRLCFCGDTRPMRITVRNGRVQSVRPEGELLPLPPAEQEWYPSIDGLFDIIGAALGVPHSASIDYYAGVADDEIAYLVSDIRLQ